MRPSDVATPFVVPTKPEDLLHYLNPSTPQPLRVIANKARWKTARVVRALRDLDAMGKARAVKGGWLSTEWFVE